MNNVTTLDNLYKLTLQKQSPPCFDFEYFDLGTHHGLVGIRKAINSIIQLVNKGEHSDMLIGDSIEVTLGDILYIFKWEQL